MRKIMIGDLPPAPWRNGGGVTREIALSTDERGMIWRLSVADVDADGPFSLFPGMMRVLTVIEGAGLMLDCPGGVISAPPARPVRFPGGVSVRCRLAGGPVRDFNLIYDPARAAMDVIRLEGGAYDIAGVGVLPLRGDVEIGGFGRAAPGSFVLFETNDAQRLSVDGAALAVSRA